jgi:hypothetical protein
MTKIKRLFALAVLISSLSTGALADGGETQGPSLPAPPPVTTPIQIQEPVPPSNSLDWAQILADLLLKGLL